jgi:hypothetical protein
MLAEVECPVELAEVQVAGGQADQRLRLGVAVGDVGGQVQGVPVQIGGLAVPAEVVLKGAEGVQCWRLDGVPAGVSSEGACLLAELEGVGVSAGLAMHRGEAAQRFGLT